jgi:hypothetical protein
MDIEVIEPDPNRENFRLNWKVYEEIGIPLKEVEWTGENEAKLLSEVSGDRDIEGMELGCHAPLSGGLWVFKIVKKNWSSGEVFVGENESTLAFMEVGDNGNWKAGSFANRKAIDRISIGGKDED